MNTPANEEAGIAKSISANNETLNIREIFIMSPLCASGFMIAWEALFSASGVALSILGCNPNVYINARVRNMLLPCS
jgi:hypothetical protein